MLLENDERSGEPGTHVRVVMELLGHSQLSETLKRYTKVREGLKRQALERLDALLQPATPAGGDHQIATERHSLAAWFGLVDGELHSRTLG